MSSVRYRFAARCEATAMPRRHVRLSLRAVPLVRSMTFGRNQHSGGFDLTGQSPNQGHSLGLVTARHGEAEPSPHIGRQSRCAGGSFQ